MCKSPQCMESVRRRQVVRWTLCSRKGRSARRVACRKGRRQSTSIFYPPQVPTFPAPCDVLFLGKQGTDGFSGRRIRGDRGRADVADIKALFAPTAFQPSTPSLPSGRLPPPYPARGEAAGRHKVYSKSDRTTCHRCFGMPFDALIVIQSRWGACQNGSYTTFPAHRSAAT